MSSGIQKEISRNNSLSMEFLLYFSKTNVENLMPICHSCNSSMGIKNIYDFIREIN